MNSYKIDRSKLVRNVNDYQIATSQAVLDSVLWGIAADY